MPSEKRREMFIYVTPSEKRREMFIYCVYIYIVCLDILPLV